MTFDWFNIFNLDEFLALGIPSRNQTLSLEDHGEKDVLITRGNEVSIVFEDVLMPISFEDENPFVREGDGSIHYAIYKDVSNDIWLGIEVSS